MHNYDFFFILSGNQTEADNASSLDQVKKLLANEGVVEPIFDNLGKQKLAYTIGQDRFGYLINSSFEMEPSKVADLRVKLKQQPEVIRYLISTLEPGKMPAKYTVKSAITPLEGSVVRFYSKKESHQAAPLVKEETKAVPLSQAELDKKLEEILKENPNI